MEVLILLVFVSLALAASGVALFAWLVREKTFEHGERLALLPLDDRRERVDLADPNSAAPTKQPPREVPTGRAETREETER